MTAGNSAGKTWGRVTKAGKERMDEPALYHRNFLLHLQERTGYDRPVLVKEPARDRPTGVHLDQLHNEHAISQQLDDVAGVRPAYAKEGGESQPALLLEYVQGRSLTELIGSGSLEFGEKLRLAVNIAAILGRIHEHQVMHKNVSSGNILVADNPQQGSQGVYLIDFGLASTIAQERPSPLAPDDTLVGNLAYISPEQTGRMNREVDYRTDLYSLGVVLYELFTGRLPFAGDDALELIHAHIAREPQPPHVIEPSVPAPVSDLTLKLLAKNAEDRYQTAHGLQVDLAHCLDQWRNSNRIEQFALGSHDFTGRLHIPQKLYGRQAEIERLNTILDHAITGSAQLLLVAGYSGVGKTSLIHEIQRDVITKQGIFVEGKFDKLGWTTPYSAWAQALTQLVNNWLTESETGLADWRDAILDAVGDNGQILSNITPALESIIGPQPQVPQLGGIENQNRFNHIFNRFVSSLATPEHPLVIFLDDLQWIDPASLSLIESLLAIQSTSSLLIIGAYRNNEVPRDHPLTLSQERMRDDGKQVTTLTLGDLTLDDTNHLLADTLQLTTADCRELSQAFVDKTAGNPFYIRQQLHSLESDEFLFFDHERRCWVWEEGLQEHLRAGGNVVDLMIRKIQILPVETQHTLSMAACIGSRFTLLTLDTITGRSQEDVLSDLHPAIQGGLVLKSNGFFSFAHDRIQEAGYSLIPQADLPKTHLEIGRALLANTPHEELSENVFEIVGHLNAGQASIEDERERLELVNLNLKAGLRAKSASAYSDAKSYVEIGVDLLGPSSWQEQYELTLSLYNENGELAYLTGRPDQIAPIADLIHAHARTAIERIPVYRVQMEAASASYDFASAIEIGLDVLEQLGFEIPPQPGPEHFQRLHERYLELLDGRPNEVIAGLPRMTDEQVIAASTIMIGMLTPTYITRPALYAYIGLAGGILTLENGVFPCSPHFFAQLGSLLWVARDLGTPADHVLDAQKWIRQMQDVVLNMVKDPFFKPCLAKALEGVCQNGGFCRPIHENIELARRTLVSGFEVGDLLFAAHGPAFVAYHGMVAGEDPDELRNELAEGVELLNRVGLGEFCSFTAPYLQAAENFIEPSKEPHRLIGSHFDEDAFLPAAAAANDNSGRHNFYAVRLMVTYHFDVDQELPGLIDEAERLIFSAPGLITVAITRAYTALSRIRLYPSLPPRNQEDALRSVDQCIQLMEIWSQSAPTTFRHMYDLIMAEKARISGETDQALVHYEQAIQGARTVEFTHDEALANELYARFWAERDNDRFAAPLMREAHSLYLKWGARAKAEHLAKRYPNWLVSRNIVANEPGTQVISDPTTGGLDLHTVLKASQCIAGEIELNSLLLKLMTDVIENSGAQHGSLILEEDGQWVIAVRADAEDVEQPEATIPIAGTDILSEGVVNYVARTQETVVLEDAHQSGDFVQDPYFQSHQARSTLCTPLINRGKTSGILYLENDLAPGVFSSQRVNLLKLLSSQMAISLDNARTHADLEKLLEERSRALVSAEAQVRTLFEDSPLGIGLSSRQGKVLAANKALLQMLRTTTEELEQHGVIDFYKDPSDRVVLLNKLQESGSVRDFGVELLRADGSPFFASINMSRLVLQGNEVLLAMVEDVTVQLRSEQEAAILEERARLARELHDSVSQSLYAASLLADTTARISEEDPTKTRQNMTQVSQLLSDAMDEMHTLLLELRPVAVRDLTLGQLLQPLVETARARTSARVGLRTEGDRVIPESVSMVLYRVAQECLSNAAKHAKATAVSVDLACGPDALVLRIADNGRGFDVATIPPGHQGLSIMSERAQQIGATIEIESKPGGGTLIVVTWSEQRVGDAGGPRVLARADPTEK